MNIFFKHQGGQCELENVQPYDTVSLIKRRLSELTVPRMTESEFFLIREENTILHDDYTLEDYEIENEEELRIEVRGGKGTSFKFPSMANEIKATARKAVMTDMNKHTFIFDGVNFKGTCEDPDCSIKSIA